jgi:hypothetical protein
MENYMSFCEHFGRNSRYIFIGNKTTVHQLLTAWRREADSIITGQQIPVFSIRKQFIALSTTACK